MKKCKDCNVEMIDGSLYGEPMFMDMEHDIDKFYVDIKTGDTTNFFGLKIDNPKRLELKVKVCPKCGKVELYINPAEIEK